MDAGERKVTRFDDTRTRHTPAGLALALALAALARLKSKTVKRRIVIVIKHSHVCDTSVLCVFVCVLVVYIRAGAMLRAKRRVKTMTPLL